MVVKLETMINLSNKMVRSDFLTPEAKLAFIDLRQAFVKAPILHHFDLECHIQIEIDVPSYIIGRVFSQLTSDDLDQWYPMTFYSQKIIPAETQYETHNGELLAILKAFRTWRHYLKGSQHELFVLINYNNLRQFIDTKSLSSKQVRWAQELSRYHFQINYRQGKANGAIDILSQYLQQSIEEEEAFQAKNSKILYCLQFSLTNASFSSLTLFESSLSSLH